MQVKGTAFLARKALLERDLGADRIGPFLQRIVSGDGAFPSPIIATSMIPIAPFLALNDAVVREFYGGDEMSYWRFGRMSGDWALGDNGPYRRLREEKSLGEFVASAPTLYRNYFTEGRARAQASPGGTIELWIEGIPAKHHHVYFEYAIVGYFERGLELVTGKSVRHERLAGFSAGDDHVHYRYRLG